MRSGFTAVEVMMALVLVSLALIPLMTLSQAQERDAFELEHRLRAAARARALLDLARARGVTAPAPGTIPLPEAGLQQELSVSREGPALFRLRAQVSWSIPGEKNRIHRYELEQLVLAGEASHALLPALRSEVAP